MAKSFCVSCKTTFVSESAFNKHRTGSYGDAIYEKQRPVGYTRSTRRCLSVAEMLAKGMQQNGKGWWTTGEFDGEPFRRQRAEEESNHGEVSTTR